MKVNVEPREDQQVKLIIEIEPEEFERAKRRVARRLAKRIKIPGFRPGKAPYEIIERRLGERAIVEEAIDDLLDDLYPKAIKESEIKPYSAGVLDNVDLEGEKPRFEILVPLEPEVKLPENYRSFRLPYEEPELTDEEVEEAFKSFLRMFASLEPVDRPAEVGDAVYVDVEAYEEGNEEGEPLFADQNHPLLVEKEPHNGEWPFPGFPENFVGVKPGDEKTVIYTYPEDWDDEDLRGKTVVLKAVVKEVKAYTVPELTDELVAKVGYDSVDKFREDVIEDLKADKRAKYDNEYFTKVVDALLEQTEVKFPPQMLEDAVKGVTASLEADLESYGISKEEYLEQRGITEDDLKKEIAEEAKKTLLRELLISEIARREGLTPTKEEITAKAVPLLQQITAGMSKKEQRKILKDKRLMADVYEQALSDAQFEKVRSFLISLAKGELEKAAEEAEGAEEQAEGAEPAEEAEAQAEVAETAEAEGVEQEKAEAVAEEEPQAAEDSPSPEAAAEPEPEAEAEEEAEE